MTSVVPRRCIRVGGLGATDRPDRLAAAVLLVLAGSPACNGGSQGMASVKTETSRVGDTTVITSHGDPYRRRVGTPRVVWRSPDLEDPRAIIRADDQLLIADRTRLHVITDEGVLLGTVGREGEGPGEFMSLAWLSLVGNDSVAVYDRRLHRMSFLTREGAYVGSVRLTPPAPFINPVLSGDRGGSAFGLVRYDGGVLSVWRGGMYSDGRRPMRTAVVWQGLGTDTSVVIRSWDGGRWIGEGPFVAPATLYGPQVITALAVDGSFAVGDGVEYCIDIYTAGEVVRRICRKRTAIAVGDGVRNPDLGQIASGRQLQALRELVGAQEIAVHLPHFDRLLFDESGRLWVRTLGAEFSERSPYLLRARPELRPTHRSWDVFDEAGRLTATVEIPSSFEPQVVAADGNMYGFLELTTGEIAIGCAAIPGPADERARG